MINDVLMTQEGDLGMITLNRPQVLNALTLPMVRALQQQLDAWSTDDSIHAVIIQSAGGKAFCAGGDVRWLYEAGKQGNPDQLRFFSEEYHLNKTIHYYKKPYIALMDGLTMGGGVGISLHGSHSVASQAFVFAMPETSIGFFPDIGASFLLSRCPGFMGIYLGLTGNRLSAEESNATGLVKYVVQAHQFPHIVDSLKQTDLSKNAFEGVSECLELFSAPVNLNCIKPLQANVDKSFNHGNLEDILKSLEEGESPWHREILDCLRLKSPTSLYVTLFQLQMAFGLDFDECIQMDYLLVQHFIHEQDFYEGVRALLIDKDKSPHWRSVDPLTLFGALSEIV